MPPFEGPRATLWVTRKPVKIRTEPSSIVVGIETSTAFLHSERTSIEVVVDREGLGNVP